jgi:molecular chaperone GrpE (heat shock protein)
VWTHANRDRQAVDFGKGVILTWNSFASWLEKEKLEDTGVSGSQVLRDGRA